MELLTIYYGSGSGSDFRTRYSSGSGSGSKRQKVTVPTVPVPVPQHCIQDANVTLLFEYSFLQYPAAHHRTFNPTQISMDPDPKHSYN